MDGRLHTRILCGVGIGLRQAPFNMPDEGAHYLRAYEVSHLHLVNFRGAAGVDIPCNEYLVAAHQYNRIPAAQQKAFDGQHDPACTVKSVNPAGAYSFVPYIPAAFALFVTEKLRWKVEKRLIAARVANFSVFLRWKMRASARSQNCPSRSASCSRVC